MTDGIKTKRLIETAETEYAELMHEMYEEPETSYGDIIRYFTENEIHVYGKTLKWGDLHEMQTAHGKQKLSSKTF